MLIFKWVNRVLFFLIIVVKMLYANELIVYEAVNYDTNKSCQFYEEEKYLSKKSQFIGTCKHGYIDGNATIFHQYNHQYRGFFKEGYYDGYGKFSWTKESYIEGIFRKNYLTGFGKSYDEGIVSIGDFYKNIFTGYGTYILDNNKSFTVQKSKEALRQATVLENNTYTFDVNVTQKISLLKKSLLIREEHLKNHPLLAQSYSTLSQTLAKIKTKKSLEEAMVYAKLALELKLKIFDMNSSEVSFEYNNLSLILSDLGRASEAVVYGEKGLAIDEIYFSKSNPNLALSYGNMALFYKDANQLIKAKQSIIKALELRKNISDFNSTELAVDLNTRSLIYQDLGDFEKAEKDALKSLEINLQSLGENHGYVIKSYGNLAMLYLDLNDLEEAQKYVEKFLVLSEKNFAQNEYDLSAVYSNVSLFYKRLDDLKNAEKYAQKSMKIAEKIMPKNHPSLSTVYAHLSLIYEEQDKLKKAIKYANKALAIRKHNQNSLGLMISYRDLSFMYTENQEYDKAFSFYAKSFRLFLASRIALSQLNHRAKKKYLDHTNIHIYNLLDMSLLSSKDVTKDVFNLWIAYKGELSSIENHIMTFQDEVDNSEIAIDTKHLRAIKREYSDSSLGLFFSLDASKNSALLKMELEKEELEELLSTKVNEYNLSSKLKELNSSTLINFLKEDELYIDFAKTDRNYYIFTLNAKEEVTYQVLEHNITMINSLIQGYRENIIKFGQIEGNEFLGKLEKITQFNLINEKNKKLLNKLYNFLLKEPIKNLNNYKKLIISPDGILNFLPFESLFTNKNKYLIEELSVEYTSSAKEFFSAHSSSKSTPKKMNIVVFSNPKFDANMTKSTQNKSIDDLIAGVEPLTYSEDGIFIKEIFKKRKEDINVTSFSEKNASKENLFKVSRPTILHISTHSKYSQKNKIKINELLLKSVLILSGHNVTDDDDFSGIVTALDFSTLNLYHTELVFFSSCESGLGDILSSEGAYGLSRAAKIAGGKRVISTLWKVSDEKSAILVKNFYKNIEQGLGYVEALKKSKIEMINQGYAPFYWAGFVENGID